MAIEAGPKTVEFGPFALDLQTGELARAGNKVRLQGQSLQILAMLLQQPGQAVSREALRQRLWSDDTYVDFDQGLNNAIKRLRESLGDSAERPKYIETLPRLGYRFVGEIKTVEAREEIAPAEPDETGTRRLGEESVSRFPLRLGWLILPLAALVVPAFLVYRMEHSTSADHNIRSIVVLPFSNLSGDATQDYFADAMTEELTSDLGNIASLRVISRTSAMHYKATRKTAPEIAQELNVDGVIEGSVVRSGDRVRITAQLIQARSDRHLWSESYERALKDVLGLQSELARTIAGQVQAVVTPAEVEHLHPASVDAEAYEAYMRGRFYLDRWTSEDSAQALHSFQRAIEIDRGYALAYVGIAECYISGVAGVNYDEGVREGIAAVTRALELKPDMGEAHAMLGVLLMRRDWDFAGAESEIRKGIALKPNYAPAHHWYSHLLLDLGRYDEAMVESTKLMELDPVSPTPNGHLAHQYLAERQWDLAIAQYKKSLAMDPDQVGEYSELGEAYIGKHMYPEAIAQLKRSEEMTRSGTEHPLYLARLGFALARSGDVAGAKKILATLGADDPKDAAYVYSGLGDRDKSIALLNEAFRQHTFSLESGYAVELDPLRSDPRFNESLHRVGLR